MNQPANDTDAKKAARGVVVTRFAPSPTGALHVGGARTALFNWAFARGGAPGSQFILRIEDTDQARSTPEATRGIIRDLRWLGLDWDQGPACPESAEAAASEDFDPYNDQVGENGPYFQSQRLDIYHHYIDLLLTAGRAYKCFKTPEELGQMRTQLKAKGRTVLYDPSESRALSAQQVAEYEAQGKPFVVRFAAPETDMTVQDDVLGDVSVKAENLEDFVIVKSAKVGEVAFPTYHLAVVVDDALMGVTHVIRAQEHLNNTPKHAALQDALNELAPEGGKFARPIYAHNPLIFNPDGSKMSKRDKAKVARKEAKDWIANNKSDAGAFAKLLDESADSDEKVDGELLARFLKKKNDELSIAQRIAKVLQIDLPAIDVDDFRQAGYMQSVLCNYLALLGWSPGGDLEKFDLEFLVEKFGFDRVGKSNSKFDRDKLFRFNGDALGEMPVDQFTKLLVDRCEQHHQEFLPLVQDSRLGHFVDAYHKRSRTLAEPFELGRFFVIDDDDLKFDTKAVTKILAKNEGAGFEVLSQLKGALEAVEPWDVATLDQAVKDFGEQKELGMKKVAQPLRVAVSGSTVSPSIGQTLVILGKESTLKRIDHCVKMRDDFTNQD
jgi:glutamyl/glutaminyl-tRNA synthetase